MRKWGVPRPSCNHPAVPEILEIEFNDGRVMAYSGVSPEVHRRFMNAPSPVSFFEDKIDENFPSTRLK